MARGYVLRTRSGNIRLEETVYPTEDLFQAMLADASEVLSGDQINPSDPRRWLLITREMPVPDNDSGASRWSLDHLYLDQDGTPTLVEVKRSSDTRLRREVVGQMLDYAANAVVYWPIEILQERFARQCEKIGKGIEEALAEFLHSEADDKEAIDEFWTKVALNLRAGKIRMLFVADAIPSELQRIIEFLNGQMRDAEVLGIEVRLHTGGDGFELLVPTVVGRTAEAQATKALSPGARRTWNEEAYYSDMADRLGDSAVETVQAITDWMQFNNMQSQFGGQGKSYGSLVALYQHNQATHRPFVIYGDGAVEIRFNRMLDSGSFANLDDRSELLRLLNEIPGVNLSKDKINSHPSFRIENLYTKDSLNKFLNVWKWYLDRIQSRSAG